MPRGFEEESVGSEEIDSVVSAPISMNVTFGGGSSTLGWRTVRATPEERARRYLDRALARRATPAYEQARGGDRPGLVPDLQFDGVLPVPGGDGLLARFRQTHQGIPVAGTRCTVEMDEMGGHVFTDISVADVSGAPSVATLSPATALERAFDAVATAEDERVGQHATELAYYPVISDDDVSWTLAYVVHDVLAGTADRSDSLDRYDVVIDAVSGDEVERLRSVRSLDVVDDLASECVGVDEIDVQRTFDGRQVSDGFEMADPFRRVDTYDMQYRDLRTTPLPMRPVSNPSYDWGDSNRAAVTAQVQVVTVLDFVREVFDRIGLDGKGMTTQAVVNVLDPRFADPDDPAVCMAAFWDKERMRFGQRRRDDGRLESLAVHLDVVAHELMHGVTASTSQLKYIRESGALNESISDIVGVAVANTAAGRASSAADWVWHLGQGWKGPEPLRDMSDPTRCQQPDHMKGYVRTTTDSGGVHVNSGIHNKAAYLVFTATGPDGLPVFAPLDVVRFYYLVLARLNGFAEFADCGRLLVEVVRRKYVGNPPKQQRCVDAVVASYAAVGIEIPVP